MHILASEFLNCLETGRSVLIVPELLSVLFSKFSIIYGLNKSLYCQSWRSRTKAATVIISRSFWSQGSSNLLGRQDSHELSHWIINLVCGPGKGAGSCRCPEWVQGCDILIHSSPHTTASSWRFPNPTFPPPSPRYSTLGLSVVSTLLPVIMNLCVHITISLAVDWLNYCARAVHFLLNMLTVFQKRNSV